MTREEALEKIKKTMECHDRKVCGLAETCEECPMYVDKDTEYEAHKVLISALSQEPCDDAISREDAIKALQNVVCESMAIKSRMVGAIEELPSVTQKSGKYKNCKYFEYDSVAKVDGVPLIVAHEICSKWGNGCKTSKEGYCYLFEPRESEEISERNMKMWEELFKAESEVRNERVKIPRSLQQRV